MKLTVQTVSPAWWSEVSEGVHFAVFQESRAATLDRIDYALIVRDEADFPVGYVTCRDHDGETVYWQYGGVNPAHSTTVTAVKGYRALIDNARQRYRRIHTLVEAENIRYLKLAMREGFRIVGTRTFKGKVLVELMLEFEA